MALTKVFAKLGLSNYKSGFQFNLKQDLDDQKEYILIARIYIKINKKKAFLINSLNGGFFYCKTDWEEYFLNVEQEFSCQKGWLTLKEKDLPVALKNLSKTNYENK